MLMAEYTPGVALERWLYRFTEFVATKHGLADALHSGDPVFDGLPAYFMSRFGPALASLLEQRGLSAGVGLALDSIMSRRCRPKLTRDVACRCLQSRVRPSRR